MYGLTEDLYVVTNKPRFTLKAILGCTAALCVTLAMIAAGGNGSASAGTGGLRLLWLSRWWMEVSVRVFGVRTNGGLDA